MMKVLRTPEHRFANLPGYGFSSHYLETDDDEGGSLRIHYLDEGPPAGQVVLCLHGEPSWSYLYRKMIPVFVADGLRAVAPDLVGFGKSDKPASRKDHTYARHVKWMKAVLERLDLRDITLVCQDWGGLIGLRLAAENPDHFARIVAANTALPTGEHDLGEAFMAWRKFSQTVPEFAVGTLIDSATVSELQPRVIAAYDAPFPDESYKEGARALPALVPISPDDPASQDNRRAWEVLRGWQKPFLTAFSDSDPITRGADLWLQSEIPGTKGQPHTTINNGGHFLQEDQGEAFARVVIDFMKQTS
jgi:haloalkane dehalogenase